MLETITINSSLLTELVRRLLVRSLRLFQKFGLFLSLSLRTDIQIFPYYFLLDFYWSASQRQAQAIELNNVFQEKVMRAIAYPQPRSCFPMTPREQVCQRAPPTTTGPSLPFFKS